MSLGFYGWHRGLDDAVRLAYLKNKVIFAAASNNGTNDCITFPAREPGVMCIHAADGYGNPSSFTPPPELDKNYTILGEMVESAWCCGPRGEVTPEQVNITKRQDGTSVATPIAAAVMALVLEFAYQPPVKQRLGPDVLDYLKSYNGVDAIFERMSKEGKGEYRNIVPWYLMKARYDPTMAADIIKYLVDKRHVVPLDDWTPPQSP